MKLKLVWPLQEWHVNQKFGANFNNFYTSVGMKGHNGVDLRATDGTEVYATHPGRVTYAGYDGSGGLTIVIRTTEEFEDINGTPTYWKTIYGHLKKDTLRVTGGQSVIAGELIALADNTGRSTGSHLHFGLKPIKRGEEEWVWENSEQDNGYKGAVDPMPYFVDSPKPDFTFTQTLRLGSKGEEVKKLQEFLAIQADGIFGPQTLKWVKLFQRENMLVADGIVGPKTRKVLNQ
jgi:murein DD-endopeptidase MepM/ murein hydrolase activator NlpD